MAIGVDALARWLIAFFFVASGAGKVFAFQPTAAFMSSIGFRSPRPFLLAIILLEIGGGLCLLFGFEARYVSVTLIVFLVVASIVFHARFIKDPVSGTDQLIHIIKNIAIIGGLINAGL